MQQLEKQTKCSNLIQFRHIREL